MVMKNINQIIVWVLMGLIVTPEFAFADVSAKRLTEIYIAAGIIPASKAAAARLAADNVEVSQKLVNISVQGQVSGKSNSFTVGFVVGRGAEGKGGTFLVRAVGPGLRRFGVANPLSDPLLKIHYASGGTLFQQDDWNDGMSIESMRYWESATGAFPLEKQSLDAAIAVTLPEGAYTISVEGWGGAAGTVQVEVYEISYGEQGESILFPSSNGKG